jgi:hypothetical protein
MSDTQRITDGTLTFDLSTATLDQVATTTTLAAAVTTTGQTAFTLTSGVHAVNGALIQMPGGERCLVTSGGGTANVVVEREYNGTTAATYSNGATVNLPGYLTFNLLSIADAPNVGLILHKIDSTINFVWITADSANTFPGGGTTLILFDNDSGSTAHLKFPGSGTVVIVLASGSAQAGPAGPAGTPGGSSTPPGAFTIGTVTAEWVTALAQ